MRKQFKDQEIDRELNIETQRINNLRISERRKAELIDKANKDAEAKKKTQFEKDKKRQIANVWMNYGGAVMSAWSSALQIQPLPVGIGFGIGTSAMLTTVAGAQTGLIADQKYGLGGILNGPSHTNGGIQTPYGEVEGGEAVINKRSTAMFRNELSAINQAGGGRSFGNSSSNMMRPIIVNQGDIIIEGNADQTTVDQLRAVQDDRLEMLREDIKTLQLSGEI